MLHNKITLYYRVNSKREKNFLANQPVTIQLKNVRETYGRRMIRKILQQLKLLAG